MIRKYQRTCPFCFELCEGFEGNNLLCGCNAKYYWNSQFWLERQKSEEQQDTDRNEENE